MSSSIEDLIGQANAKGLRVNNLAQLSDGTWRANLRRDGENGNISWGFGYGDSPGQALQVALVNAEFNAGEFTPARRSPGELAPRVQETSKTMEELGL